MRAVAGRDRRSRPALPAFLPQRRRSPAGASAGVVRRTCVDLVEERRGAVAERARLALRAGELDRRREEHRLERRRGRRVAGRPCSTARERSGALPVQEVVVHLHHDPAAGRERDARAVGEPVAAPARRPGGDPARVVERARARLPSPAGEDPVPPKQVQPGAARAARRARVASATWLARDAEEDHVVHDRRPRRARSAPR